jgi:hypothetical protein
VNRVVESAYQQVSAIKRGGREPREIYVGAEEWRELCLLSREQAMFAGLIVPDGPPRLLGLPFRILPIKSCLDVVP